VCPEPVPGLEGFSISAGVLEREFDAASPEYHVRVGLAIAELRVTPVAFDPCASVLVNGEPVPSGEASQRIPLALSVDPNAPTVIEVTTDSGTDDAHTYTIRVDRASGLFDESYLKASNRRSNDRFGTSVALSRGTLVVGAPQQDSMGFGVDSDQADSNGDNCGAVYVFVKADQGWQQQAYLKASNPQSFDEFGAAVAIDGDTVVVGAPGEDGIARGTNGEMNERAVNALPSGAAYVFQRTAGHWAQRAYLKASDSGPGLRFGSAVSIAGSALAVGAPGHLQPEGLEDAGAAYIFRRSGEGWFETALMAASRPGARDLFGSSVAISGERLVVGAPGESSNSEDQSVDAFPSAGAAYVFGWNNETWVQTGFLKASNARAGALFGKAVAIDAELVAIGSPGESSSDVGSDANENDEQAPNSGAVYLFANTGQADSWEQTEYLKASNAELGDWFGSAVALRQGVLAVSATGSSSLVDFGEDSGSSGIDGAQDDEQAPNSGAVYLFSRSGVGWAQQAYVKASNPESNDRFGSSVAVADGDLAIGAQLEDSFEPDDTADNTATASGAVYARSLLAEPPEQGPGARGLVELMIESNVATPADGAVPAPDLLLGLSFATDTHDYQVDAPDQTANVRLFTEAADPFAEVIVTDLFGKPLDASAIETHPGDNRLLIQVLASSSEHVTYSLDVRVPIPVTEASDDGSPLDVSRGMRWESGSDSSVAVDISGDTLVLGVPYDDLAKDGVSSDEATTLDSGAVYVFVRDVDGWKEQAYLKASNAAYRNHFGTSVALDGDTLIVGARGEASPASQINGDQTQDAIGATETGAAYVFVRNEDGEWHQQAYLKAFNAAAYAYFGSVVAIDGDTVVVGSPGENSLAFGADGEIAGVAPASGAAYVFHRNAQQQWSLESHLKATNTVSNDRFGTRVAIFDRTIAVTAPDEQGGASVVNGKQNLPAEAYGPGAVYTFYKYTYWQSEAYIKAPNYHIDTDFGRSLALGQDILVVGATGDQNRSRYVNSDEFDAIGGNWVSYNLDNSLSGHGAVYVFERNTMNGNWYKSAYLKASNSDGQDAFGRSVSLVGNYLAIGASGESSSAAGTPGDNGSVSSGAVYLFHRSLDGWSETSFIKSSTPTPNFGFGCHVALDELATSLVVGVCRQQWSETFDAGAFGKGAVFQF
jgi:hypothetical protein